MRGTVSEGATEGAGLRAGQPGAEAVLADFLSHLTTGLASAVNLLNPALIRGGAFDDAPEAVFDRVRNALHANAFPVLRDSVRIADQPLAPTLASSAPLPLPWATSSTREGR